MKSLLSKYCYQLALVFIGLVWLALLNELLQIKAQNIIYPDSDNYREAGQYFYQNFTSHYYRPLGMAMLFGLPYLFGADAAAVYEFSFWVNSLVWLATGLLIFSFLKNFLTRNKAFFISLLYYGIIGIVFVNFHLLTEPIYIFLVMLAFYLIDKYYRTGNFNKLAIAVSILLFTILIKPGAMFLVIVLIVFFSRILLKNIREKSTVFIYLGIILIAFHCIKMKQEYGKFTISYIDGVTYYNYLGSKAAALREGTDTQQAIKDRAQIIFSVPYRQQKVIASNDMTAQLNDNKANLVRAYISDIWHNSTSYSDCITICRNIDDKNYFEFVKASLIRLSKFQNILFTFFGALLALYFGIRSYKRPDVYALIGAYIGYTIAISGVSYYQGDRFHIVFFPFVLLLAGRFYADRFTKNHLIRK